MLKKEKTISYSSLVFYIAAAIIAVIGAVILLNDFKNYLNSVNSYVAQGYDVNEVTSHFKTQFLVEALNIVGLFGGLFLALIGIGIIIKKAVIIISLIENNAPESETSMALNYEMDNEASEEAQEPIYENEKQSDKAEKEEQ